MAKKLSSMSWDELQKEMSIAGNPEQVTQWGWEIEKHLFSQIDATNRAELTNVEIMLRRLIAEVKLQQLRYDKSH